MKEYQIIIEKTARYFTLGELNNNTKSLWILVHGYGQLAKFFLRKFNVLDNGSTFAVAPEAVNKFYLNGFSGRVGATWMTKENREMEISDNIKYLQKIFNDVTQGKDLNNIQINILGFSQGVKTVCRWVFNSHIKINNLILWGGTLPNDMDFDFYKNRLSSLKLHLVIGENDEFISSAKLRDELNKLNGKNIKFTFHGYKGKHDIDKNVLNNFLINH